MQKQKLISRILSIFLAVFVLSLVIYSVVSQTNENIKNPDLGDNVKQGMIKLQEIENTSITDIDLDI